MKKETESLSEMNEVMVTLLAKKNPSHKPVHASRGQKVCKGFGCRNSFAPKRKNQLFCSSKCRLNYFGVARNLGVMFLENSEFGPGLTAAINNLINNRDSIKKRKGSYSKVTPEGQLY